MCPFSVVIITYNESANIEACISSVRNISNDIIVVDAESQDGTQSVAQKAGARTVTVTWKNYGYSRNTGALVAKNDWILSLDADERLSEEMMAVLKKGLFGDPLQVYGFYRRSFFVDQKIKHGTWGRDKVFRLYHRKYTRWDESPVHEKLLFKGLIKKVLPVSIIHYPVRKEGDLRQKLNRYASLSAQKYRMQQRSSNLLKRMLSPVFVFFHSYFILFGFLDGRAGFFIAKQLAWYTKLKYTNLARLQKEPLRME